MGQQIEAQKQSIGNLLGRYERRPVVLPQFQRSYSWDKSQVSAFWTDLNKFSLVYKVKPVTANYFLGPIVIMSADTKIILLDGQQRLATATLLLAALRDISRSLDTKGGHKGGDFARDIQRELLEKDTDPVSYSLQLSELDESFFLQAIKKDSPASIKIRLRSHQLIRNAYDFLATQIRALIQDISLDEAITIMKTLQDALTKGMTLIAITVKDEDDAFNIFETLNDRGLRLSVPDLVINLLLRRCPDDESRKNVRQQWNNIATQIGKRDISRFLRHMWTSRYGDIKAKGLFSAIKGVVEENNVASVEFSEQCAEECDDYLRLLEIHKSLPKAALPNLNGLIRYLSVNSSMPLLLSGLRCLSEADFEKLLKLIVSLYIRHSLIANKNPNDLESAFFDAAREIRAQHSTKAASAKCYGAAKAILVKLNPTDKEVEENTANLIMNKGEATWLMTQLANSMQSKTKEIGMDKANLEHIFPQNPGAEWPDRSTLDPYTWHVGNLTILGKRINQKAKNKAFTDKCKEHYSKSEIVMTHELLTSTIWDEAAIKKRAEHLAKQILKVWAL